MSISTSLDALAPLRGVVTGSMTDDVDILVMRFERINHETVEAVPAEYNRMAACYLDEAIC